MVSGGKKIRQYLGLLAAILVYYTVHEGSHLVCAVLMGVYKGIRFMGLGVQVDVAAETMTAMELAVFCAVGSVAAMIVAYAMVVSLPRIVRVSSKVFKACMYYITAAMLLIDPLYLSVLCGFFGGGDMNGISLIIPEKIARGAYGVLLVVHAVLFLKIVLPGYRQAFAEDQRD